ncbi:hypothetical protein [Acetobacterium bakii]|uniref:hypothetical protein n=1 Tax=Acetobacterium bakii TaxID=52689 RepID=UPI000682BFC1|nr:hypothetical protein [Acetobacterium bakii]
MKKITVKLLAIMMMLSMVFTSSALAATDETKTSAWDSFTGLFAQAATTDIGVQYKGHIQDYGNMPQPVGTWVTGADQFGTTGESKRIEGLNIELTGNVPAGATIQYKVHIQDQGDSAWITGPNFAGTVGLSRQIEAIYIKLVDADGNALPGYSVSYMGHIQDYGNSAWVSDGARCGTQGEFKRIEAISIKIVKTTDLTAYNVALGAAEEVVAADYTAASYAALEKAVNDNVVTAADTQAEVDAATKAITDAQAQLVKVTNVTAVTAINPTTATVQFSNQVVGLDKSAITVTNEDGNKQYIKSVELAKDGLSAAVTFYNAFVDETTYNMSIAFLTNKATGSFDYVVGEVAVIKASSATINPAEAYELEYTVLTDTGIDVTDTTAVVFQQSTNNIVNAAGVIPIGALANGHSVFVEIVAGDIKSDRIKITANSGEATEFSAYTVTAAAVGDLDAWNADDFEADTDIAIGQNGLMLDALFLDQYGAQVANLNEITYESLDPELLIVDVTTGKLTPRKVGTADIKVENGDITQVVTIEVVAAPEFDGFEFQDPTQDDAAITALNINPAVDVSADVNVQLLDQYEEAIDPATEETLTVTVTGDSVESNVTGDEDTTAGVLALELTAVDGETGTTTIKVESEDGTIVKSLVVSIVESGDVENYKLEGLDNIDLFVNAEDDTIINNTSLNVFPVDANGVKTGPAVAATWAIEDQDGANDETATGAAVNLGIQNTQAATELVVTETGTYTLTAKVGTLEVVNTTFQVVDTEAAYEINQIDDELTIDGYTTLFAAMQNAIEVTQDGEAVNVTAGDTFSVVSANTTVIGNGTDSIFELTNANAITVVKADGTATVYVDEIVVNGKTVTVDFQFEVDVTTFADLAAAKKAAKDELTAELATYTQAEYSAENWTGLTGIKTIGDTNIDAATTIAAVNTAKTGAIDGMKTVPTRVDTAIEAINNGTAVVADYTTAEITGVTATNLVATNAAVVAAAEVKGSYLTVAEIQVLVV